MLFFCAHFLRLKARGGFRQFYSNPDALQVAVHTNTKCFLSLGAGAVFIDSGLLKSHCR